MFTNLPKQCKIELIDFGTNLELCEYPTLNKLQEFSKENDGYYLYLNNHGVSKYTTEFQETARSWRELMTHFVIENHQDCIDNLSEYDICGTEWMERPLHHFSGNWWWTRLSDARFPQPESGTFSDHAGYLSLPSGKAERNFIGI